MCSRTSHPDSAAWSFEEGVNVVSSIEAATLGAVV
jgi:hypothetical protein